jgi:hypothetical protein
VIRPPIRGLGRALLLLALLLPAPLFVSAARAAEPKRVLIIHSYGRDFAPYSAIGVTLRTDLTQLLRQSVAFHEASLDSERGGAPEDEGPFVEYLQRRSRDAPPDLVVTIAPPAMSFYLRHRDELFPGRPLLVTGIDYRRVEGVKLAANDRLITVNLDIRAAARTMLDLQPDVSTVAIVLGASPLEQFWTREVRRELAAELGDRVRVLPPDGLNLEQMRQRVAALPPKSAVMYYMFAVGGDGAQYANEQALAATREASNARVRPVRISRRGSDRLSTPDGSAASAEVAMQLTAIRPPPRPLPSRRPPASIERFSAGAFRNLACPPAPKCAFAHRRSGSSTAF